MEQHGLGICDHELFNFQISKTPVVDILYFYLIVSAAYTHILELDLSCACP
jgi:hypothetical protein